MVVGFAAETGDETGDVLTLARAKLARKGCDLLVVNEVGAGKAFGTDDNTVTVLTPEGTATTAGPGDEGPGGGRRLGRRGPAARVTAARRRQPPDAARPTAAARPVRAAEHQRGAP